MILTFGFLDVDGCSSHPRFPECEQRVGERDSEQPRHPRPDRCPALDPGEHSGEQPAHKKTQFLLQDFGGDRGSVTVMGHGTGAACLHYLMTSDALPHGKWSGKILSQTLITPCGLTLTIINILRYKEKKKTRKAKVKNLNYSRQKQAQDTINKHQAHYVHLKLRSISYAVCRPGKAVKQWSSLYRPTN